MKKVARKVLVGAGAIAASSMTLAQVTVPTEITTLFTDSAAMGAAIVAAGITGWVVYRGALVGLNVAKRVLGKIGL